jgi:serine/threonine protein kinase/tetratricopeptide (TPR) repeat protein
MQEFQPGETINKRYRTLRKLGAGAMGSVYLCEDSVENQAKVALKILVSDNLDDQDVWAKGEYEALTRLRHPNLAKVYNFGRIDETDDYFIVSEFIKGIDLYSATEFLNYDELIDIIVQICRALEYIHSQGYVHFDIKPDNILVTRYKTMGMQEGSKVQFQVDPKPGDPSVYAKPNVKVIDFGLAEKITGSFSFAIKGTLNYLAPEILNGHTPDKRADLYSLGVTLYQVANRKLPFYQEFGVFDGGDRKETKRSDLFEIHMKKHPEFLQELIMKLLQEKPEERFKSARDVIQSINRKSNYEFEVETRETRASYFYSARLVGRKKESNWLREYYERQFLASRRSTEDAASPGAEGENRGASTEVENPALVVVSGEMGAGKSRLLEEFQHFLKLNDVPLFIGNCYEGAAKAYQPYIEILRHLIFAIGIDSQFFEKYSSEVSRLLPDLRPAGGGAAGPGSAFRPDKEKIYFIERMAQLLIETARECPYVLVINNLHWMDEASLDLTEKLLEHLVESRETGEELGLLLIASLRPEEVSHTGLTRLLEGLREDGKSREILVRRMKQRQIHELLCSMLSFSEVPEAFVNKLEETTGGNPLFIVETLKALEDEGVIKKGTDGWAVKATNFEHIQLPRSMEDVLGRRLAKFDTTKCRLLDVLSILGKPVSPKFVQTLGSFADSPVLPHLRELEETGVVAKLFDDRKLQFQIAQPKVREILYSKVPDQDRQRYHAEVASALQDAYRGQEDEILEDLAYHYQRSDQREKAIDLTIRAGDWLRRIFANERAFDCYLYVLEQLEGDPERVATWIDTQQKVGDLCVNTGRYDVAERSYAMLLDEEVQPSLEPARLVRIHLSRGKIFEIQGDYDSALRSYKDARNYLSGLEKNDLTAERVHVFNSIGWVYVCMGRYEKAMAISLEALRVIQGRPEAMEHAIVYNTVGSANFFKGNVEEAITYHRKSLQIREHLENIPEITTSLNNLGTAYMAGCDYGEAFEHFKRAMANSEAIGDPYGRAVTFHNFAKLYYAVGQKVSGDEALEESLKLSKAYSMKYLNSQNFIVRGTAHKLQGAYSKAEGYLFRALTSYTKQGNRWGLATVLLSLAEVHRLSGNYAEARASLDEAGAYAEELHIDPLSASCLIEEARLVREEDQPASFEAAIAILERAAPLADKGANPETQSEVWFELAETLVRLRRLPEAKQYYECSERKLREVLDMLPEEFRPTYRPHSSLKAAESVGRRPEPPPTEPVKSPEAVAAAAQESLRRVSELMGRLQSGESLQSFLRHWLEQILPVSEADLACCLAVRGEDVTLELCAHGNKPLGRAEDFLCLEYVERALEQKQLIHRPWAANDPLLTRALQGEAARVKSVTVLPFAIPPADEGVLYLVNSKLPSTDEGAAAVMQPFVNLAPLAYMQLQKNVTV